MRTQIIHNIQRKTGNYQLTEVGRYKSVGIKSCTLNRIIGHHCAQRSIRNIHDGIHYAQTDKHRQNVSYQRVALKVRAKECQESEQCKWDTAE